LVINPLVGLKIAKQLVNATEIGALIGINTGKAIEVPTIPNSETVIKNSVPKQAFDNLTYFFVRLFLFFLSSSNIGIGSLYV
jgi:hypothetical protein